MGWLSAGYARKYTSARSTVGRRLHSVTVANKEIAGSSPAPNWTPAKPCRACCRYKYLNVNGDIGFAVVAVVIGRRDFIRRPWPRQILVDPFAIAPASPGAVRRLKDRRPPCRRRIKESN